jgi:hypothetical protein
MKRALLGAVAAALLVLTVPAAASAQTRVHTDPANDVWYTGQETIAHAPAGSAPDIRRVYFAHGRHLVRAIVTVNAINPDGGTLPDFFGFSFVNKRGLRVEMSLGSDDVLSVRKYRHGHLVGTGCRGVRHAVNPVSRRAAVTFPRTCVGSPRYLRLSADVTGFGPAFWPGSEGLTGSYADDGYSRTRPGDTSPTVHHSKWTKRDRHAHR